MAIIQLSVIIPVYNSDRSVSELVDRLHIVFNSCIKEPYEIILVDDCSPQKKTWEMLSFLTQRNPNVRAFQLSKNFGQASALLCGMAQAKGNWIVTMDDDLQHRPEDIPLLLEKRDHDVVIANFPEKQCTIFKKLFSEFMSRMDEHLLGNPRHIKASPFRLLKNPIVQSLISVQTHRPFLTAMILSVTSDVVNVSVKHEVRKYGKSNYSLRKSFSLLSNMLFNNSSFMLRAMSVFGFGLAGLSFVSGLILVFRRIDQEQAIMGWTSLMVVLLMSTGAIICCLGILGEYVARLIAAAESRPAWVIREQIDTMKDD